MVIGGCWYRCAAASDAWRSGATRAGTMVRPTRPVVEPGRAALWERRPSALEARAAHQQDDLLDVILGQPVEHHGLVDPVEELGPVRPLELLQDAFLHLLVGGLVRLLQEPG